MRRVLLSILVSAFVLLTLPTHIPSASAATMFHNGFETGNFAGWSGTRTSLGETVSVVNARAHHGAYSGRFHSNGNGNYEIAYCYRSVPAFEEIWTRCYVYVTRSGINSIGDRIFFIVLRSGTDNVAYAGWKMDTDGKIKWCFTVNSGLPSNPSYQDRWYVTLPSEDCPPQQPTPVLNRWYCVEINWRRGTSTAEGPEPTYGDANLYVNGLWAVNMGRYDVPLPYYDPVSSVRFGLAEQYGCTATTVYCDCCAVGNTPIGMQGPVPKIVSFSASPNPFTPNEDHVNDYTTIRATFNTGVRWILDITDESGESAYLSTWGEGQNMSRVWSKETTDSPLLDGRYKATLSITDVLWNTLSSRSIIITIHNARPIIYSWVIIEEFSPSIGSATCMYYGLSESCYITVRVYNNAGCLVRTLLHNVLFEFGDYEIWWDGLSSTGAIVPLGDYRIYLYAIKISGKKVTHFCPDICLVKVI